MVESAGTRVMRIREIVHNVLGHLPVQKVARSLSVNKLFWAEGVKYVWEDLEGMEHLVAVGFPTLIVPLTQDDIKIRIPEEKGDLHRLRIYGSYVRRLSVFAKPRVAYQWRNLSKLWDGAVLTPRLEELHIRRHGPRLRGADVVRLLQIFFAGSCRSVVVSGCSELDVPWLVCRSQASQALTIIGTNAARLDRLEIFAKASGTQVNPSMVRSISQMANLRKLGLSIDVLTPDVMTAIGALKRLGYFTIRGREHAEAIVDEPQLRDEHFSSLTHLAIWDVEAGRLNRLIALTPLLSGVRYASFVVRYTPDIGDHLPSIFEGLRVGATLLQDLSFTFPSGEIPYRVPRPVLESLLPLPLKRMQFLNACVEGPEDCGFFYVGRFPELEQLLWPQQPATWDCLRRLARRWALRVLRVQLANPALIEPLEGTIEPVSKNVLRLESDFRFAGAQPESIDNLARFLLSCWFDVELKMHNRLMTLGNLRDCQDSMWYLSLLNQIARLRDRAPTVDGLIWRSEP